MPLSPRYERLFAGRIMGDPVPVTPELSAALLLSDCRDRSPRAVAYALPLLLG